MENVRDASNKLQWEKRCTMENGVDVHLARCNTDFFVELGEAREVLLRMGVEEWSWRRELADGNEFAVILQVGHGL